MTPDPAAHVTQVVIQTALGRHVVPFAPALGARYLAGRDLGFDWVRGRPYDLPAPRRPTLALCSEADDVPGYEVVVTGMRFADAVPAAMRYVACLWDGTGWYNPATGAALPYVPLDARRLTPRRGAAG